MRYVSFLLLLAACGGNGVEVEEQVWAYRDLGALEDAIADAADKTDSDGDSIPDSIETELGLDPHNRDTDFDGLVDNYELFEEGYRRDDPLPDKDRDDLLAAADDDEDGDRVNDGVNVDTDGDGVPNYLEYYGYSYEFLTGTFVLWNGDPDVPHWFTDPLQWSTDQDAYSDGTEVSGLGLDPTVRAPGDDPLVAAYPNIVIEVASYSVTANETIQISHSESIAQGRNWSRSTTRTHSYTSQFNWGVGVKAGFEAGGSATGPEGKVTGEVSANIGGSYSNTNSTSVSRAEGSSITSAEGWSEARSSNPTDAAHLKLFLKVHNRGTGPVSNMKPTLTLKIGGLSVATFEPGNSRVNMLVPGATYPEEPGVYWVVDAALKGGGAVPISLTLDELRALERGAPLSVSMTQIEGDSMRLEDGAWQSTGDVTEYVARCDAVGANLRIDLGEDGLVHHLVFAGEGPSAPGMTLGDALSRIGVDEEGTLTYADADGHPRTRSLDGFRYAIDTDTLRRNGWELEVDGAAADTPPDGFTISETMLFPRSNVVIRAPRDPMAAPEPELHYAYFDAFTGEIAVSAADYEGILTVVVESEDGSRTLALSEDVPGAGFYSGVANEDSGFEPDDELFVVVTNLAGFATERQRLGRLFQEEDPAAPEIGVVTLNLDKQSLYVNAASGNPDDPRSTIEWVRVFHPDLETDTKPGYRDLGPVIDFFRDPDGWTVDLPPGFDPKSDVEVVAYVQSGVWTNELISPDDAIQSVVLREGAMNLVASFYNSASTDTIRHTTLELDASSDAAVRRVHSSSAFQLLPAQLQPEPQPPIDLTLRMKVDGFAATINWDSEVLLNAEYQELAPGRGTYDDTTKGELAAKMGYTADPTPRAVNATPGIRANQVYALRTTRGKYAKIYVESVGSQKEPPTLLSPDNKITWTVRIRYTVYE